MTIDTSSTPTLPSTATDPSHTSRPPALVWAGLFAMMLTSFALVSAEFLPSGLLTAMADDLGVSPGVAGQTVTVTAIVGFLVAPTIGILIPRLDRRTLLVVLAAVAAVSDVIVAIAPSLPLVLISRILLGAALSGFWSMSLTVAQSVAGPARLARAMTVVNAGTMFATVAGVPLGIALSSAFGWRAVFVIVGVLSLVVAVALRFLLPSVPAATATSLAILWDTMRRPGVGLALSGHVLMIFGHFAAYSFIRLALERVDGVDVAGAASLLLVFGVGGFIGNLLIGALADRMLETLRVLIPVLSGASILALTLWPSLPVAIVAVTLWGITFGGWIVVVNTWAGRNVPDRLEAGGGLIVAGFQLGIAVGAAVGGLLVDAVGPVAAFVMAGSVAIAGGLLNAVRPRR